MKQILVTGVDSRKDIIFLFNSDPISACEDHIKATAGDEEAPQLCSLAVPLEISRALPTCVRSLHQGDHTAVDTSAA